MEKDETEDALPSDGRGALVRPGWSFTDKDDEARYRDARQKKCGLTQPGAAFLRLLVARTKALISCVGIMLFVQI